MCGRYTITSTPDVLRAFFGYSEQPGFPPRYNIAPTQPIPIVRLEEGERHFALVRWGLIPSWVKDPNNFALLLNARGESATEKPAFRNAMKRRRCLVPADGFYEWKPTGGRKQPYYIRARSGAPLAFAGLWETWEGPNGEEVDSATIVTTRANRLLGAIHDRMPVIVSPEAFDLWLDCAHVDAVTASALIAPAPEDLLEIYPVSLAVNRTANDNARLLEPFDPDAGPTPSPAAKPAGKPARARREKEKKDDGQGALF